MPTIEAHRSENASRKRRRAEFEQERIQRQYEARAQREAYQQAMKAPTLCYGCDQLFRREDMNAVLFGLHLCGACTAEARKGSTPLRVSAGFCARPAKSGRWATRYRTLRSFVQSKTWAAKPLKYTAAPAT
ncbi:hypothetical protein NG895_05430 [Aeoliella sp. ICT_H6.2]|uniref:Uncharacterized protein n=1 Tax=Aeoliella straminimaris TaxID=2954799 RepID=A0A9X2F848_9BACT|nr:hypothetical protein [Aeoliella straminimaris]MCO6043342.1 hypothetical protein [Aeoliella straminimaris]